MIIEIECGCNPKTITCTNKMNLLEAIASREVKNHEQLMRHGFHINSGFRSDEELEDVSIYAKPDVCFDIKYSADEICKYGCKE